MPSDQTGPWRIKLSQVDMRGVFRQLTEALAHEGAIEGFSLVSHSMENPKDEDQRCRFTFRAEGLPGKTAEVTFNLTKLLTVPALRDNRHQLVSNLVLAVQENLEAGGHRHLADSEEDVLVVNLGKGTDSSTNWLQGRKELGHAIAVVGQFERSVSGFGLLSRSHSGQSHMASGPATMALCARSFG